MCTFSEGRVVEYGSFRELLAPVRPVWVELTACYCRYRQ
jgi:hypothetical protein